MKSKGNKLDLTTGSVSRKLIAFAMPILASNLLQHLYNAVDRAVVGKFAANGEFALAAVGSTGAASALLLNLFLGLSIGANVICSNLRGANKHEDLRKTMHTSVMLAAVSGLLIALVGFFLARPFLTLMGSPKSVIDSATLYMRIYFVGVPFSLLYNFCAGILRAHGDTKQPMIILGLSGLVNVALNLVFVILCGMDVDGVAWATVISQLISAAVVMHILFKPHGGYGLTVKELKLHKHELKSIFRVGIPSGLNGMVFSVANVVLQSSINSLGDIVMAGSTAAESITGLVYQVLTAFYTACVSFSGQCYGAGEYKRIDKLLSRSLLYCCSIIAVFAMIASIFPYTLLGLFTDNPDAIAAGFYKMVIICWGYVLYGASEVFLGILRGMRKSGIPTLLNGLCACVPRLLWVYFAFPLNRTIWFLCLCYPLSWFLSASAQGLYLWFVRRKLSH